MEDYSKIIYSFFKRRGDYPFEFNVYKVDDKRYNIVIMVDVSKMDKNGPNYDENYRKLFEYSGSGMFKTLSKSVLVDKYLTKMASEIETILGLWKNAIDFGYNYKNYEYLDNIDNLVQEAIKKTSYPEAQLEITADWDKPFIKFIFRNVIDHQKFKKELEINLSGIIDLSSYHFVFVIS